ncbi:MAG: hypothetical protein WBL50_11515 [Candidatus Acidiferrum sp.]
MLTISNPPATARANSDNTKLREMAKTAVARPKPATQLSISFPERPFTVRCARKSPISAAPMPGAQRRQPRPKGPTARISLA